MRNVQCTVKKRIHTYYLWVLGLYIGEKCPDSLGHTISGDIPNRGLNFLCSKKAWPVNNTSAHADVNWFVNLFVYIQLCHSIKWRLQNISEYSKTYPLRVDYRVVSTICIE